MCVQINTRISIILYITITVKWILELSCDRTTNRRTMTQNHFTENCPGRIRFYLNGAVECYQNY